MDSQGYFDEKRKIENALLRLMLEETDDDECNFNNFIQYVNEQMICDDGNEFRLLLNLINSITRNHCRNRMFYSIVNCIILNFKDEFKKYFSEFEILKMFICNKPIILILLENDLLAFDEFTAIHYIEKNSASYYGFFYPEIKEFLNEQQIQKIKSDFKVDLKDENFFKEFNEKRRLGVNDSYICKLIRDDSIEEFVEYVNQKNIPISGHIMPSIFETNQYLINNNPTLIEYAAFYGSIQIFQYLKFNNVELTPSLWLFAIHSNNPELIYLLEECEIKPKDETYKECLIESIICHHNDVANYIKDNHSHIDDDVLVSYSLIYYNFYFIPNDLNHVNNFYYYCYKDYYNIVQKMLKENICPINHYSYYELNNNITFASLLCHCIDNDNTNIVKMLLRMKMIDFDFDCISTTLSKHENKTNAYYLAASNNNFKMIQLLFEYQKPDINCKSVIKMYCDNQNYFEIREKSPLMQAILFKNIDIIKMFLSDPAFNTNFGYRSSLYKTGDISWNTSNHVICYKPLLHEAIEKGYVEIVKMLLENPNTQINKKMIESLNSLEETAISLAIKKGNIKIIKLLLDNPRIKINKKSKYKINDIEYLETPLHLSIREQKFDIAEMLINRPDIDINKKSTLSNVSSVDPKLIDRITETALHLAVKNRNIEIIKILVDHPNIDVNTKCSKYFYEKGINNIPSHEKNTALNMAVINGDDEIISILLSNKNIDYNYQSVNYIDDMKFEWNPLTISIYYHKNDIAKKLLTLDKININSEIMISKPFLYTDIQSALYLAIEKENNEIVKLILMHPEVNVNYVSIYMSSDNHEIREKTVLHLSFEKGDLMIIKSLLAFPNINLTMRSYYRNSDKSYFKEYRETIFTRAIKFGNTEIMQFLLSDPRFNCILKSKNIDINQDQVKLAIDKMYETALLGTNVDIFVILLDFANKHKYHVINIDNLTKITENIEMKNALERFLEENCPNGERDGN